MTTLANVMLARGNIFVGYNRRCDQFAICLFFISLILSPPKALSVFPIREPNGSWQ
jgi:hypothetical protein